MRILVSGIKSGIGKYIYEHFQCNGIGRGDAFPDQEYDYIIHCAFNQAKNTNDKILYGYLDDNIFITKRMLSLKYKKFIYISTVDVYPKDGKIHNEEEIIEIESYSPDFSLYAYSKLLAESIIKKESHNYLILRCSMFLHKYSRNNSLIKLVNKNQCQLSISGKSDYNCISGCDLVNFLHIALNKDLMGIYNISSSSNATAEEINKEANFGNFLYKAGQIDNKKLLNEAPFFNKSTLHVIEEFSHGDNEWLIQL